MKPGQTVFVTIDGKLKKATYEGPIPALFERERERERLISVRVGGKVIAVLAESIKESKK